MGKLKGIPFYKIFFDNNQIKSEKIDHSYCIFVPNYKLCGHPNIIHGGASAAIIDVNSVWLAMLNVSKIVATISMDVKYLKPMKKNQTYVWKGVIENKKGRQIHVKSTIEDLETKSVAVEATVVMMIVNWEN